MAILGALSFFFLRLGGSLTICIEAGSVGSVGRGRLPL